MPEGERPEGEGEPLFTPPDSSEPTVRSHEARWAAAAIGDDDTIQSVLAYCNAATLRTLKALSPVWRQRARHALGEPNSLWRTRLERDFHPSGVSHASDSSHWSVEHLEYRGRSRSLHTVIKPLINAIADLEQHLVVLADGTPTRGQLDALEKILEDGDLEGLLPALSAAVASADPQVTLPAFASCAVRMISYTEWPSWPEGSYNHLRSIIRKASAQILKRVDSSVLGVVLKLVGVRRLIHSLDAQAEMPRSSDQMGVIAATLSRLDAATLARSADQILSLCLSPQQTVNGLLIPGLFNTGHDYDKLEFKSKFIVMLVSRLPIPPSEPAEDHVVGAVLSSWIAGVDSSRKALLLKLLLDFELMPLLPVHTVVQAAESIVRCTDVWDVNYMSAVAFGALRRLDAHSVLGHATVLEAMLDGSVRVADPTAQLYATIWPCLLSRLLCEHVPLTALTPYLDDILAAGLLRTTGPLTMPAVPHPSFTRDAASLLVACRSAIGATHRQQLQALCDDEATHVHVRTAAQSVLCVLQQTTLHQQPTLKRGRPCVEEQVS